MTEEQWLRCNTATQLLAFLGQKASGRKLRLFACAAARRMWHLLLDERSRQAVETAERHAEGLATDEELQAAQWGAHLAQVDARALGRWWNAAETAEATAGTPATAADRAATAAADAGMVGEVFGNPFRPIVIEDSWLRWNDGTVRKIAQAIYDEPDFSLMPILADALEDAGCDNDDILRHCREPGQHVRGCWVVDLLLAKE